MNETSKVLSIVAYYFSEYSEIALQELGYTTYSAAFSELSKLFGRPNNYLKLRRDEYDALPESHSPRQGWHKRAPTKEVVETAQYLRQFNYTQLTQIVKSLIDNAQNPYLIDEKRETKDIILPENFENILNQKDDSAGYKIQTADKKIRVYSTEVIHNLKQLYSNRCQICGCNCGNVYGSHLVHAHHIDYFSRSMNNDASNILIVCPNHHGIIHDTNAQFDKTALTYHYPNGYVEGLKINVHL